MEKTKINVYEMVSRRIEELLDEGIIPWQKGWIRPTIKTNKIRVPAMIDKNRIAYNGVSGGIYSFLNQMLLMRPGAWATFNQVVNLGGKIKKGEKSSFVVYYNFVEKTETDKETGEEKLKRYPVLRYYSVFHIATQTEGIDESKIAEPTVLEYEQELSEADMHEWDANETADKILSEYMNREGIEFAEVVGDESFYTPAIDTIHLPLRKQFKSGAEYYGTFAHECIHSTGHKKRLDRLTQTAYFGTAEYAKEELVAEIGACAFNNLLGMETENTFKNNVAYIQHWKKAIHEDKNLIVSATSKAEKALEFIINGKEEKAERA